MKKQLIELITEEVARFLNEAEIDDDDDWPVAPDWSSVNKPKQPQTAKSSFLKGPVPGQRATEFPGPTTPSAVFKGPDPVGDESSTSPGGVPPIASKDQPEIDRNGKISQDVAVSIGGTNNDVISVMIPRKTTGKIEIDFSSPSRIKITDR